MKLAIFLLLQVVALVAVAQEQGAAIYQPKVPYSVNELAKPFEQRRRMAVRSTRVDKLEESYDENSRELRKMADAGVFLHDEEAEAILNGVMKKLVDANPQLKRKPQQVLITRETDVNAISFGESTFGVTTGMLTRMDSEATLASLLAHELSHYELDHQAQGIQNDIENKTSKKVKRGLTKIAVADERVTTSDIDSLRKWVYSRTNFHREKEAEADSLGIVLLTRAGYPGASALTLISLLDSANVPKYHLGNLLHNSFNSTKVPFQEYWTSPRLSLFENEPSSVLFFSVDSLNTHPGLPMRRTKVTRYLGSPKETPRASADLFWNADLENIESALFQKKYDHALLLALTVIPRMPGHAAYLKGVVARVLVDIYSVKDTQLFAQYVPTYIGGYSKDLKTVNAFLHNIHKEELGELAFDYINRKGNFDQAAEVHYYQLWRICDLTDRDELKTRVKKAYKERFGKGEYYGMMDHDFQINLPKRLPVQRSYN